VDSVLKPEDYLPGDGYNAYTLMDRAFDMCRKAGLLQRDHFPIGYSGVRFAEPAQKARLMEVFREKAQAGDWPQFIVYLLDEPQPQRYDEVVEHAAQWRRLGAATTAAMSPTAAFGVGHVHNAWIVLAGSITPEMQREAERLGAEVWVYDYNLRATNVPANRFYTGLYTWSLGLKGNIQYAYIPGRPHPHASFDADWKLVGTSILGYVIPSPVGPVPGVGWEGRREGVDDVRYLQLLEARMESASASNPTAREARQWLADLRSRSRSTALAFRPGLYNAWGADYMDPDSRLSPHGYDALRTIAARYIEHLPAAPGERNDEPSEWVHIQPKPVEAQPFIGASLGECLAALKFGSVKQKRQAAGALALHNPEEILTARDLLIGLLDKPEVRLVALRALARLGPDAAPAIPAIRKLLASKDSFIRVSATYTLTRIGEDAKDLLIGLAEDPDYDVLWLAREALEELDKP